MGQVVVFAVVVVMLAMLVILAVVSNRGNSVGRRLTVNILVVRMVRVIVLAMVVKVVSVVMLAMLVSNRGSNVGRRLKVTILVVLHVMVVLAIVVVGRPQRSQEFQTNTGFCIIPGSRDFSFSPWDFWNILVQKPIKVFDFFWFDMINPKKFQDLIFQNFGIRI